MASAPADANRTSAYFNHREGQAVELNPRSVATETAKLALDPVPFPKAGVMSKQVHTFFDAPAKTHHRVHTVAATKVTIPRPNNHSTEGQTNAPGSLGFLANQSSTHEAIGTGEFSQEAVDAFRRGKDLELEAARRRGELQAQPFQTAEPTSFAKSSQAHGALHAAANRERPARFSSPREVPVDDLHQILEDQRAAIRAQLELSRTKSTTQRSTQQDHYSGFDTSQALKASGRFASNPIAFEEDKSTETGRRIHGYATEYSDNMQDRHHEAVSGEKFGCKETFKLVNGIVQMNPRSHHPRNVVTNADVKPSNVVPSHFQTTMRAAYL